MAPGSGTPARREVRGWTAIAPSFSGRARLIPRVTREEPLSDFGSRDATGRWGSSTRKNDMQFRRLGNSGPRIPVLDDRRAGCLEVA